MSEITYAKKFAFCLTRFRSILQDELGEDLFDAIYGTDNMISEDAVIRFQDIADSGRELDVFTLLNLRLMASSPSYPSLRPVMMLAEMYGADTRIARQSIEDALRYAIGSMEGSTDE